MHCIRIFKGLVQIWIKWTKPLWTKLMYSPFKVDVDECEEIAQEYKVHKVFLHQGCIHYLFYPPALPLSK